MGLDIRLPIGLMFSLVGLLLTGYGLFSAKSEIYATHSLGININLIWGVVLVVFGVLMLVGALRARKANAAK
jgi:lipopolysaccharide export LptBFGC system permease protein LptF